MIPYGRQDISEQDIQAVTDVLKSDWLTQGPAIVNFEQAVAASCEAKYGVATSNATAALHVACLALGVGQGDIVWTSPNTFVASANCARYCGASIDFVDIDPQSYNMDVCALRDKLERAERSGSLPKLVIPVHFAGQSCDMQAIWELAEKYGFKVIEDASHAIGGSYLNQPVGNCRYSDITIFSFHPVKIITTAEGGMAMTNNAELDEKLRLYRSHGTTRDTEMMEGESDGPWYYQQIDLGFNYRITDIQAALGLSQLQRLEAFCLRRHEIASVYDAALDREAMVLPWQHPDSRSAYHLYPIQCRAADQRTHVFSHLRAQGLGVNVHYIPVHLQPYYRHLGFKSGDFPEAEKYYSRAISIPMFAAMTDAQQQQVIQLVNEAVQ